MIKLWHRLRHNVKENNAYYVYLIILPVGWILVGKFMARQDWLWVVWMLLVNIGNTYFFLDYYRERLEKKRTR